MIFKYPPLPTLSFACAALLAAAYVAQYLFHLHPCELCLLQRYPYMAVVAVGVLGGRWPRAALALCGVILLGNALLAGYHAGVEWHWFPGPTACTDDATGPRSLDALRAAILAKPTVLCDQAALRVAGLSMAGWNALAALALSVFSFYHARYGKKLPCPPAR